MNENKNQQLALTRFAAVSWIEQYKTEGHSLAEALRVAALRPWPDQEGKLYAFNTLEEFYYNYQNHGFKALIPVPRKDSGCSRNLSESDIDFIVSQVQLYPHIPLKTLYRQWIKDRPLPHVASLYRLLRRKGLDARSIKRGSLLSGPTKAFETPFVNDLWMTDFSPGPTLKVEGQKILKTHLCLIVDDHSRLICFAAYYAAPDTAAFHDTFKQALLRRGKPKKIYTDNGSAFISHHTRLACANLNIRLLHSFAVTEPLALTPSSTKPISASGASKSYLNTTHTTPQNQSRFLIRAKPSPPAVLTST